MTVKQREELRRQLKEAMEGIGQGIFRNYRICNPRGNEFHVLLAMKMIKMQPEFHVLLIGCMRQDLVLEEKIQQDRQWNRIEESMERLRRTILKLPTGCAVLQGTAQLELVSGNEEFFRTIGYSEEEIQVLPNDFLDAVYREDRRQLKKVMEELLHTEKVGQCDIRICGKNGEIRWIALNIRLFYYQGRTPYFLVSSWDIHRRKRVEEKLTNWWKISIRNFRLSMMWILKRFLSHRSLILCLQTGTEKDFLLRQMRWRTFYIVKTMENFSECWNVRLRQRKRECWNIG